MFFAADDMGDDEELFGEDHQEIDAIPVHESAIVETVESPDID